jgi:hypothetical protein
MVEQSFYLLSNPTSYVMVGTRSPRSSMAKRGADELFTFVKRQIAHGDVWLFSLVIGRNVSHSLVDGLTTAGGWFSQVMVDEREGMESKVVKKLTGWVHM